MKYLYQKNPNRYNVVFAISNITAKMADRFPEDRCSLPNCTCKNASFPIFHLHGNIVSLKHE